MDIVFESAPLLYTGVFILGALIGSFLNVVIFRLPSQLEYDWRCQCEELLDIRREQTKKPASLAAGRSRCPSCSHKIRAWENIPLFSYFILRGKCSSCQSNISIRYPIVELATALLFVFTIWHFGPTVHGLSALLFTSILIACTGIDIDHQLLPDNLTIPLMWGGIILSFWTVHADLPSSVLGAIGGYLILWTIYQFFKVLTGKEGMGYGDFKLLAAVGAWLGWQSLPLVILLSSVLGAFVGLALITTGVIKRENPIPFGPYIAISAWIALIWGETFLAKFFFASNFS